MVRALSLKDLLGPNDREIFLAEYWENRPLSVIRSAPDYYAGLLSLDEVDALIGLHDLPQGSLRLLRDGDEVPSREVNRDAAFRHFGTGGTLAVNGLQSHFPRIAELSVNLGSELSCRIQANIYLTPQNGQGFVEHYDDHDVFILQVVGHKEWSVYGEPQRPLPLRGQTHQKTAEIPTPAHGPAVIESTLRQGDLLYIPRGFVHTARSTDATSLHITLGIHSPTWSDVFAGALKRLVDQDVRFRRSLPVGIAGTSPEPRHRAAEIARELRKALGELPLDATIDEMVDAQKAGAQPLIGPRLTDIEAARRLTPQSRIARRDGVRIEVRPGERMWVLRFNQKTLEWPETADTLAQFVASAEEFVISDAPQDLGPAGVASCIESLVREGAFRVLQAEPS